MLNPISSLFTAFESLLQTAKSVGLRTVVVVAGITVSCWVLWQLEREWSRQASRFQQCSEELTQCRNGRYADLIERLERRRLRRSEQRSVEPK